MDTTCMQLEEGKPIKLELNDEQSQRYWDWIKALAQKLGEEDEQLEDVTISFIFTPYGQEVIAHTGGPHPSRFGNSRILAGDDEI